LQQGLFAGRACRGIRATGAAERCDLTGGIGAGAAKGRGRAIARGYFLRPCRTRLRRTQAEFRRQHQWRLGHDNEFIGGFLGDAERIARAVAAGECQAAHGERGKAEQPQMSAGKIRSTHETVPS
jgi:hypothetical protein